ncbi:DUF4198 domain-containing protein [Hymenobacter sp. 102]|uniref:DUF4198 domain-containing protein n=1 Tax=Hymenobacter sp. 102 TaxID=3403152 RepID=UPI003CE6FECE
MRKYLFLSLSVLVVTAAAAREFWLEPTRFQVLPGAQVHIRRLIGSNFQGEAWAGKRNRLISFWHFAPGQPPASLLALPTASDTLASTVTLAQPGTHLLALTTDNAYLSLSAADFAAYVEQENLQATGTQPPSPDNATKLVRESYRRCAKTLVQAGPAVLTDTARAWARVLNLPLELVPEQNPYTLAPGAAFTVRVLRSGRPVAGQPVALWLRGHRPQALLHRLRSNQNGRVLFRLSEAGEYLASTVYLQPTPSGFPADWQSTWSTLTFGIVGKKRP